jgi:hypothetical protein
MRSNTMRMISIVSLSLILLAIADPLVAAEPSAELSGTVYRDGVPGANLTIKVEGREDETRTDSMGRYRFHLPPGDYVLVIRDQRFPVKVLPKGTRQDIRF